MKRDWDHDQNFENFHLVNEINVFKSNTLEGVLVESVIEVYKNYNKLITKIKKGTISIYAGTINDALKTVILKKIKQKNLSMKMDESFIFYLPNKAVWYARISGCLEIVPNKVDGYSKHNKKPLLFGVYLEAGLNDLWEDHYSVANLKATGPHPEKTQHLLQVAQYTNKFKEDYQVPSLKCEPGKVIFSNIQNLKDVDIFYKQDHLKFPMQTWNFIDSSEVHATTRGSFHHLGDEMAFVLAALKFGDCCIVGNDEFGELLVLKHINGSVPGSYISLEGTTLSVNDFDYIYGVPRTHCFYPTAKNNLFTYADENRDHCKCVDKAGAGLSNQYWNNQTFLKYAGRAIRETTIVNLGQELKNAVEGVLSKDIINQIFKLTPTELQQWAWALKIERKTIISINKKIEKKYSFFIKTIAHKVSCTIFNPNPKTSTGFFKKMKDQNNQDKINHIDDKINLSLVLFLARKLLLKNNEYKGNKISSLLDKHIEKNIISLSETTIEGIWKNPLFWQKIVIARLTGEDLEENFSLNHYLYEHWQELEQNTLVQSQLVPMQYEYRIFVINNKVAATSPCFRNTTPFNAWNKGIFDPRLADGHNAFDTILTPETRKIVAQYAKFSRKFVKEMKQTDPQYKNYVLDLCWSKKNGKDEYQVLPVEVNSINFSGAYQIDFRRVCAGVAKKPRHQGFINTLNLDYAALLAPYKEKPKNESQNSLVDTKQNDDFDEKLCTIYEKESKLNRLDNWNKTTDHLEPEEYFSEKHDQQGNNI